MVMTPGSPAAVSAAELPCARKARHHRAERNGGDGGDFLVGETLQLAQHDHFAEFLRQPFKRRVDDALGILFLETALDRAAVVARVAIRPRVEGCLVERDAARRYLVALEPRVIRIAHDAEEPCAAVLAFEAVEEAERAQKRFLRHVLGIALIARQPAREVVGRIQVRGEEHLETLNPACLVQAQGLLWALGVGRRRRLAGKRIYPSHPPITGRCSSLFPGISVRRSRYYPSNTHLSKETGMPSTINRRQFLQLADSAASASCSPRPCPAWRAPRAARTSISCSFRTHTGDSKDHRIRTPRARYARPSLRSMRSRS